MRHGVQQGPGHLAGAPPYDGCSHHRPHSRQQVSLGIPQQGSGLAMRTHTVYLLKHQELGLKSESLSLFYRPLQKANVNANDR